MDPKEFERLVPQLRAGFNPTKMSQPLEAHEIDMLVVIDGKTSVASLATLKSLSVDQAKQILSSLAAKEVVDLGAREKAAALVVEAARSYVPKGLSKRDEQLKRETPSPGISAHMQDPGTRPRKRPVSADIVGMPVERVEAIEAEIAASKAQRQPRVPSAVDSRSNWQAAPAKHRPPPTSVPPTRRPSATPPPPSKPVATPADAPQINPGMQKSASSASFRAPSGPRRPRPSGTIPSMANATPKMPPASAAPTPQATDSPTTQDPTSTHEPKQAAKVQAQAATVQTQAATVQTPVPPQAPLVSDSQPTSSISLGPSTPPPVNSGQDTNEGTGREGGHKSNIIGLDPGLDSDALQAMLGEEIPALQLEEGRHVAKVITAFARVTSCFRLYDARNDAVHHALVELFRLLRDFLKKHDNLALEVQPWELLHKGEVVYRNTEREHSLSFKLFRDGIRKLTFKRGMPWTELAQFLKILGVRYHGIHMFEDDIVTLLWKADLTYLEATAIEGFALGEEQNESPTQRAEGVLAKALEASNVDALDLATSLREEEQHKVFQQLKPARVQYQALPAATLAQLKEEESTAHYAARAHRLLDLFEAEVRQSNAPMSIDPLERLLREFRDYLVTEGMLDSLQALVFKLKRWQESPNTFDLLGHLFAQCMEELEEPLQLKRLLDGAKLEDGNFSPALHAVLSMLPNNPAPALFQLLSTESHPQLKQTIRAVLLTTTGRDSGPFIDRMSKADVPMMKELLIALHQIQDAPALAAIVTQLSHPDERVQSTVRKLLDDLIKQGHKDLAVRDVIGQLLLSIERPIRMRAYQLIQSTNDAKWASTLMREVESQTEWDDEELEQVMRLAAKLSPHEARETLLTLATPPGRFQLTGERPHRKRQRIAAIAGLAMVGGKEAEDMLKLVMQKLPEHKEKCVIAMRDLRRIDRGVSSQTIELESFYSMEDLDGIHDPGPGLERNNPIESAEDGGQEVDVKQVQEQMQRALQHVSGGQLDVSGTIRKQGYELIMQLHMLIKNSKLYDKDNRIFEHPFVHFAKELQGMLKQLGDLTILGVDGQLYVNETRIRLEREGAAIGHELFEDLARVGVGSLTFVQPMTAEQLHAFVQRIARFEEEVQHVTLPEFRRELEQAQIAHCVELTGEVTYRVNANEAQSEVGSARSLLNAYTNATEATTDMCEAVEEGRQPNPLSLRRASHAFVDAMQNRTEDTNPLEILALASVDSPLQSHLIEVAMYTAMIGAELGLPRAPLADLTMCAFFHDIGHTAPEGTQGLAHTRRGLRFLAQQNGFQDAKIKRLLATAEHHMEHQHKITPQLHSRILKVADTFALLASPLHGVNRVSPAVALQLLWGGRGTHFDPAIVQALTNQVGLYPPGTLVALQDQSVGVSLGYTGNPKHFARPRLLIVRSSAGKRSDGPIIPLHEPTYDTLLVHNALKANEGAHKHVKKVLIKAMQDRIKIEALTAERATQQQS